MGIRQLISRFLRSEKGAEIGGINFHPWQFGRPVHPDLDYSAMLDRYRSWVYACAHQNAVSCAQTPLRLFVVKSSSRQKSRFPTRSVRASRKDEFAKRQSTYPLVRKAIDIEEVIDHPAITLLDNVNEFMNQFDLLEGMFLWQELTGNAYWHIDKDDLGVPTEIWPLMPHLVRIVPDPVRFIKEYLFRLSTTNVRHFAPEEIIQFKYLHPKNMLYGLGPLQASILAVELSSDMNLYEQAMFKNNGIPDFVITFPEGAGRPGKEDEERIWNQFKKRYRGVRKAGLPYLAWGGAKIEKVAVTPKEMAFLQGRKATMTEIAAVFRVPMSKLTVEDVNRANAEAGEFAYMKDTITPKLIKAEQKLNERLAPMFDENLFFAFDNVIPQDKEFRLKQSDLNIKNSYASINEERAIDGRGPVSWGDKPMAYPGFGVLDERDPSEREDDRSDLQLSQAQGPDKAAKRRPRVHVPALAHPTNFENLPLARRLEAVFRQIEKSFFAEFSQFSAAIQDQKAIKTPAEDLISSWLDLELWAEQLADATTPFTEATLVIGARRALESITTDRPLNANDPAIFDALNEERHGRINGYVGTPVKEVRAAIAEGIAAGENTHQIRKRIETVFDDIERNGALRIARTETVWAWNRGAVMGYAQSGQVVAKKWVTAPDERRCPWCASMEGKIVGLEKNYFDAGNELTVIGDAGNPVTLKFNYEDVLHPPLHTMCRCTIVPITAQSN